MLPYEVLELVFSYLPPKDLDTVPQVCSLWCDVASDKVWKHQFLDQYGTTSITRVATTVGTWRKEVLRRRLILQKWRRGAKNTDKTMNTSLKDATDIYLNLAGQEASAYCFNSWQGNGVAIDLERGKIQRRLHASKYSHETTPVTVVDGSRFGVVYGFFDGNVNGSVFSRDGTFTADCMEFPYRHSSSVCAVWAAKTRNFAKPISHAISVASGSQDGTIFLTNRFGYKEFQLSRSRVLKLDGCMYGSNTANDGDSLVALYANGELYQFSPSGEVSSSSDKSNEPSKEPYTVKKLTTIPLTDDLINDGLQLTQCNDCVIIRTRKSIYVFDLLSNVTTTLNTPDDAEITAFAMDMSFTPGTKNIAAGLSTNEIYMWSIQPSVAPNNEKPTANKIVLVNARASLPKEIETAKVDDIFAVSESDIASEERQVNPEPLWIVANPIGYEARLQQSNKPQITKLALNSAVLLVAGYNGRVYSVDALTGATLKRLDSRFSKTVLDFSRYSRDGFVPVTHLLLDSDPSRLRGLIAVRPAIQFFDLGSADAPKKRTTSKPKRTSPKRRHHDSSLDTASIMHDLHEELALNEEFAMIDAENAEFNNSLREDFALSDMEDEEQIEYALMLSQQQEAQQQEREQTWGTESPSGDFDEDLRRALEMSRLEEELYTPDGIDTDAIAYELLSGPLPGDDDDAELRQALALSLNPDIV